MIKFFRNIRKKLLAEGNTGKYFKYAIGEIILVMIGILLALQVNTWNNTRLDLKEEQKIIINLKNEFEGNQNLLKVMMRHHDMMYNSAKEFSAFFGPEQDPIDATKFNQYISALGWTPSYHGQKGVINSVISSGKLSLLKNSTLVIALSSITNIESEYYRIIELLNLNSEQQFEIFSDHYSYINMNTGRSSASRASLFKIDQKSILQNRKAEGIVDIKRLTSSEAIKSSQNLYEAQENILNLINSELKRFE